MMHAALAGLVRGCDPMSGACELDDEASTTWDHRMLAAYIALWALCHICFAAWTARKRRRRAREIEGEIRGWLPCEAERRTWRSKATQRARLALNRPQGWTQPASSSAGGPRAAARAPLVLAEAEELPIPGQVASFPS